MSDPSPEEFGPKAKFNPQLLLQWFVFPMLMVVLCVGLYLSFSFLTAERKTALDYIQDLRSGNPHRAWQAAFALANQVNLNRIAPEDRPVVGKHVLEILEETTPSAGQIRQYLILTLGRLQYPPAIPKLVTLVRGSDASEKIYALMALREMKAEEGNPSAEMALEDPDPGVRKTAVYFLGSFLSGHPDRASKLTPLLNDPVADVRWNAALSLAEISDASALPILLGLLDRAQLSAELQSGMPQEKKSPLDEGNVEKILQVALAAATGYQDKSVLDKVQSLAERDPNMHVQAAAREALLRMRGAGKP